MVLVSKSSSNSVQLRHVSCRLPEHTTSIASICQHLVDHCADTHSSALLLATPRLVLSMTASSAYWPRMGSEATRLNYLTNASQNRPSCEVFTEKLAHQPTAASVCFCNFPETSSCTTHQLSAARTLKPVGSKHTLRMPPGLDSAQCLHGLQVIKSIC